jgi:wyosine [tRNA(Phe)-imidazoG37] synthetase (radical SAM superfamily)
VTCSPDIEDLPKLEEVLEAVEKALLKPRTIDILTFSGNGEPTLHPNFAEIVQGVRKIRDRLRPNVRIGLLSNSSTVSDEKIRGAVVHIDSVMMKLDAGDSGTFHAINRPAEGIQLSEIIKGLKEMTGLVIQSMLIDGQISNISGTAYQSWVDALKEINPSEVHIYSIERLTAENSVVRVGSRKLKQIERNLKDRYSINARAFWSEAG